MNYWEVFKTTVKQWWHHKYLWVIGIIGAVFMNGGSSSSNFSSPSSSSSGRSGGSSDLNLDFLHDQQTIQIILIVIIVLAVIGLIFFVLGLYLNSRAQSSLIQATEKIGKDDAKLGFRKAWALGKTGQWTIIKYDLLVQLPALIIVFTVAFIIIFAILGGSVESYFDSKNSLSIITALGLFLIVFLCCFVIYSLVIAVGSIFGKRISILENIGTIDGLKKGFAFVKSNFGDVIVFWLLSMIISTASGVVTLPIVFAVLLGGVGIMIPLMMSNMVAGIVVGVIIMILFSIIMILIEGPVFALTQMYWTNVYLAIKKK